MRVLFDHNVPKRLRSLLLGHHVTTSRELGWDTLRNGDLLNAAEASGFEAMVTGDKNMSYQQNLTGRKLSLVVLADTDWPTLKQHSAPIVADWLKRRRGASRPFLRHSFRFYGWRATLLAMEPGKDETRVSVSRRRCCGGLLQR